MANPWLRLWTDMPNDPKWRTIARASKQSISLVQAVYLQILVEASNADERGRTQPNAEDIGSALDEPTEAVDSVLAAMQGRVLSGGMVTGWEKRQPKREDSSAERAKEWRERNRTQPNATEPKIRVEEIRVEKAKEAKPSERAALEGSAKEHAPTLADQAEVVTKRVMQEAPLSGMKVRMAVELVAGHEIGSGLSMDMVTDLMLSRWRDFKASAPKLEYQWGAEKFFGEGNWKDKAVWPWKDGMAPIAAKPGRHWRPDAQHS